MGKRDEYRRERKSIKILKNIVDIRNLLQLSIKTNRRNKT